MRLPQLLTGLGIERDDIGVERRAEDLAVIKGRAAVDDATAMPKGAGAPLYNASPMMLAAYAGNAAIIPRLAQAGDRIENTMLVLGFLPTTVLQAAVFHGDANTTRAALDAGAQIDRPDDDGITPLGWAAIGNDVAVARVLIERGADLNHVDKKGITPLLYAASIDFGDSAMVDLLLKSGARRDARSKEGLTAEEWYESTSIFICTGVWEPIDFA